MKLGIMQPYFLPYIGYFQLIKTVDVYVIYDDVQYIKGGWINRNNILLHGQKFMINLLLSGASPNKMINEVLVQRDQRKLLKTIEVAYKRAPFFKTIYPEIIKICESENLNLAKFVGNSIQTVSKYLKITTKIIYSSEIVKNNELKAHEKVIEICKLLGANTYLNAIGGQELYHRWEFLKNGIDLKFIQTKALSYPQFRNEFVENLSILDVMMFNSIEEINRLLDKYELI